MRQVVAPAAIAALGVVVVLFVVQTVSSILSVVTMMGRYPESMLDYVRPVLESTVPAHAASILAFGVATFGASVLLIRVTTSIPGAVWRGVAISVVATIVSGLVVIAQTWANYPEGASRRGLAEVLVSAANVVGQLFLTGTPLVVLASVLLVSYLRARSLTEPQTV